MRELLRQLISDSLTAPIPPFTRRDAQLPEVRGKAVAVIGMRRSGKTTFLWQCLADRLAVGAPRETLLYLNFEDERLAGMQASDLQWVVEEYYRLAPGLQDRRRVTFFFDEIQIVPGWETFARRLMDSEHADLFLTGSSARLLSREVATSMRGRAMEVLIHPFSFREALRHAGFETSLPSSTWPKSLRSEMDGRLREYLTVGGFPEAQGVPARDRVNLLRTYVDVVILRDVIERHSVSNPLPLRWLQRHLLSNAASHFSVQKFYDSLRSQGIPVGKDTLHSFLGYLEDAFLVRVIPLHTASERQRMVNPRKIYPVDPGLLPVYERTGRLNLGRALETAVLVELERRGFDVTYVRTNEGFEVDFLARSPEGRWVLLQVCADLSDSATRDRETRALAGAAAEYPDATPFLITLDAIPPQPDLPEPLRWQAAAAWLLDDDSL
ncbi:MAG: ATP-binding protein [Chloroflexi bacterium]|nr:ATP-binding protein [Chloroflexota bacterium]